MPQTTSCGSKAARTPAGWRRLLDPLAPGFEDAGLAVLGEAHRVERLGAEMVLRREADPAGEDAGVEVRELVHRLDEALARHLLAEPLQDGDDGDRAARAVEAEIGDLLAL